MATAFDPHVGQAWIERVRAGSRETVRDGLAVEEPLEIRADGEPLAVTMRTPGEDEELAVGFLAGEGLIACSADVVSAGLSEDLAANTVDVRTRAGLARDPAGERRFYLTSSCGVCGKGALEFVDRTAPAPREAGRPGGVRIAPEVVLAAPESARDRQRSFDRTGGLHATALFSATGDLLVLREDVGRHNAMDKALGRRLLDGAYPVGAESVFACLSGRASFELVQKARVAGLTGVVSVGAPSTLAVELAREGEMLLCGFVRGDGFNVYSGSHLLAG